MEPTDGGSAGDGSIKRQRGFRKKNGFFKYLERRKTDTIVAEDFGKGDINLGTLVRRSQSDKTEYSTKLKGNRLPACHGNRRVPHEKMGPQVMSATSSTTSLDLDPEEMKERKMIRRSKVIQELLQTESDYLNDLELCIREVVQPLRKVQAVDAERLFTNMEAVCELSGELLRSLQEATVERDLEAQLIGDVFIQAKAELEEVYKTYCCQHDEANTLLKSYEKDEEIKQHFTTCILALKGKPNLLDMGSLIIKPVQRVMKYPLLLGELWQTTPEDHRDRQALEEALAAVKIVNININECKRRKDIVMKYKRPDEEGTLIGKLNRLNIHSIRKKSDRLTGYLKILTGVEPQVKDEVFDKEEKLFRSLEKCVRQLVKNVCCYLYHVQKLERALMDVPGHVLNPQEMASLAVQHAQDLENIIKDPEKSELTSTLRRKNGHNPYQQFKERVERVVLTPLSALQGMFAAPQKLIQKRYDKLLDYCSRLEKPSSEEQAQARRDYEALNGQLVEELQRFNGAARAILLNCLCCLVGLLRGLLDASQQKAPSIQQLPAPLSNIGEVQSSIMEGLNNLSFVKDNAPRLMERKVSFEKPKKASPPEVPRQTESQRSHLLATYGTEQLYQLKRNCNACQEEDITLLEGELVGLIQDRDPLGSSSRWLVDTGSARGYVYSSFLKPYNPARERGSLHSEGPDDFDNISLFVSGGGGGNLPCDVTTDPTPPVLQFYAVHAFQARCEQELTLQEYQHVHILQFCDLSGNREWWLAEIEGKKGYVPANYLGKMSYA
ncbi:rho guanine nucleotide exchange factor 38-like [Scleropages formosus]|uniref:Dynamin-binding protein n=1 Tax=Scleropages formosus TaxID=113540 RepID=A0A0P7X0A3_SCLFO|nr:rho guanine nucleotide exchange factor 38-like [Scleropages formosus]